MEINVNGIDYNLHKTPVVGICMDGTSYDYYRAAAMPHIQRFIKTGNLGFVKSVIPSFTNPNNIQVSLRIKMVFAVIITMIKAPIKK